VPAPPQKPQPSPVRAVLNASVQRLAQPVR
jgi:hypothetical protein